MAKNNGFSKLSYPQLLEMRSRLDAELASRQATERQRLKEQMEALAAKAGFSVGDILGELKAARKSSKGRTQGKVAPKYRNPKDPTQTWTGRGRMPLWMGEALKKGQKKEAFLI